MQPILLLTKKDTWCQQAGEYARQKFGKELIWEQGTPDDPPPASFNLPHFRAVISFLSPWIVPKELLAKSDISLNFHPGSCDYPGIGCYNFALYEEAREFGPVCHHMLPKVDSGTVIAETLFPVTTNDSVETLKLKTMQAMLPMFKTVLDSLAKGQELPTNNRQWTRRPFTRRELNALCEITPDMDAVEEQRRIRATTYPGYPGPYKLVNGKKQFYPVPNRQALA